MTVYREVVVTIVKTYAVELDGTESDEEISNIVCEDFFGGYEEMDIKDYVYSSDREISTLKRHADDILEL